MAVPSQRQLHRPVLEIMVGAQEDILSSQEIKVSLAKRFSLVEDDLKQRVPSGHQTRFENRIHWAISYLKRAGLLDSPMRSHFRVTPEGRRILETLSGDIGTSWLNGLIEARRQGSNAERRETGVGPDVPADTVHDSEFEDTDVSPDEQIEELHRELNERLADDLLESVKNVSADGFERLVVRLLEAMEYGQGQRVGGSGDQGIDGVINQDPLGLEKVYIQAKRWQNQVGEPEIRNFSGSLEVRGAGKGVFITTSTFSSTAANAAERISAGSKFIRLIDGRELARLMIAHNVGVITEITYDVKKLDENYFAQEL